ncbi:MAG: LamG domain-containing protein, partial [Thiotrichaceae bacterium]
WPSGEAINLKRIASRRRGIVFNADRANESSNENKDHVLIKYGNDYFNSDTYSFEAWVRTEQPGVILAKSPENGETKAGQLIISLADQGELFLEIEGGMFYAWTTNNTSILDNAWHHIAITSQEGKLTFYIDGEIKQSLTRARPIPPQTVTISADGTILPTATPTPPSKYSLKVARADSTEMTRLNLSGFQGELADIRLWDRALNPKPLKDSMYLPLDGNEADLIGYWRLGGIIEGSPRKVVDLSVQSNDGIVLGNAYVAARRLSRTLSDGVTEATRFENSELIAVRQGGTYEEIFEFRLDSGSSDNDNDNDNGAPFTVNYWGKSSRESDDIVNFESSAVSIFNSHSINSENSNNTSNPNNNIAEGWQRIIVRFTVPDDIKLVRSFGMTGLQGSWDNLHVRRHTIRLVSDSISIQKSISTPQLKPIGKEFSNIWESQRRYQQLQLERDSRSKEKVSLEGEIKRLGDSDIGAIEQQIRQANGKIKTLNDELRKLNNTEIPKQINNRWNYWHRVYINHRGKKHYMTHDRVFKFELDYPRYLPSLNLTYFHGTKALWRFKDKGNGFFEIISYQAEKFDQDIKGQVGLSHHRSTNKATMTLSKNPVYTNWKLEPVRKNVFHIYNQATTSTNQAFHTHILPLVGLFSWPVVQAKNAPAGEWVFDRLNTWRANKVIENLESKRDQIQWNNLPAQNRIITRLQEDLRKAKNKAVELVKLRARLQLVITDLVRLDGILVAIKAEFQSAIRQPAPHMTSEQYTLATDARGLRTIGGLLSFVQLVSDLHINETSKGDVLLNYFDQSGALRQTAFDAASDGKNATYEQWLPENLRFALDLNQDWFEWSKPIELADNWSMEFWWYQSAEMTAEPFIGFDNDGKIAFNRHGGLMISWKRHHFSSSVARLSEGWHHLAFVKRGSGVRSQSLFFIDGKKIVDMKALGKSSYQSEKDMWHNSYTRKQKTYDDLVASTSATQAQKDKAKKDRDRGKIKLENSKRALNDFMSESFPAAQSINTLRGCQFAEFRLWQVALSDEEVAVNSNILLTGDEPGLVAYYPFNMDLKDHTGLARKAAVRDKTNGNVRSDGSFAPCPAPIGNPGHQVLYFNGYSSGLWLHDDVEITETGTLEFWFRYDPDTEHEQGLFDLKKSGIRLDGYISAIWPDRADRRLTLSLEKSSSKKIAIGAWIPADNAWHHLAVSWNYPRDITAHIDGKHIESSGFDQIVEIFKVSGLRLGKKKGRVGFQLVNGQMQEARMPADFHGEMAEFRLWDSVRSTQEIQNNLHRTLTGNDSISGLNGYWPLRSLYQEKGEQDSYWLTKEALKEGVSNRAARTSNLQSVDNNALPVSPAAIVNAEYVTYGLDPETKKRTAMMRRFYAIPKENGVELLAQQREEALELIWIGNAQYAPTLLGYMEGPPPVPSENLTVEPEAYQGATAVELSQSDNLEYSWNRSKEQAFGTTGDFFAGYENEFEGGAAIPLVGKVLGWKLASIRAGIAASWDVANRSIAESQVSASSSNNKTDRLELHGHAETEPHFPHLGNRFIPKNIGYALVISGLADVF